MYHFIVETKQDIKFGVNNIKQRSLKEVKDDRERTLKEIQRGAEIAVKNLRGYFNHF